jgi:hypothetical protein
MDFFDDIAALAAGEHEKVPLQDAVQKYEKDGVTRVLGLWRRCVVLSKRYYTIANLWLQVCRPFASAVCTGRERESIPIAPSS